MDMTVTEAPVELDETEYFFSGYDSIYEACSHEQRHEEYSAERAGEAHPS